MDTINDLANVVKIKNEISTDIAVLSLQKLVEKVEHSLSQVIRTSGAVITKNFASSDKLKASKTYMESIVLNLISNAIKYSKDDVVPRIEISASSDENDFILQVKDNGLGIDLKKHGEKIFGLRKTFHKNRDSRGVGLFITKAQIEAMEGSIHVESTLNVGSTFIVRLPKKIIV